MEIIQSILDYQTQAWVEGTGLPAETMGPAFAAIVVGGILLNLLFLF